MFSHPIDLVLYQNIKGCYPAAGKHPAPRLLKSFSPVYAYMPKLAA